MYTTLVFTGVGWCFWPSVKIRSGINGSWSLFPSHSYFLSQNCSVLSANKSGLAYLAPKLMVFDSVSLMGFPQATTPLLVISPPPTRLFPPSCFILFLKRPEKAYVLYGRSCKKVWSRLFRQVNGNVAHTDSGPACVGHFVFWCKCRTNVL